MRLLKLLITYTRICILVNKIFRRLKITPLGIILNFTGYGCQYIRHTSPSIIFYRFPSFSTLDTSSASILITFFTLLRCMSSTPPVSYLKLFGQFLSIIRIVCFTFWDYFLHSDGSYKTS